MNLNSKRIGISTASYFDRLPLEEIIDDFGKHNLDLCEIFLNTWSEYDPEYIDFLKEKIEALPHPLTVNSIHPMSTQFEPQLFSVHPRQSKDAFTMYERVLEAASALNAGIYVMHGPIILQHGANPPSVKRFIPIFRDLSDIAESYGVILSLENVSWCLFHSPDIGKELADSLGDRLHYTLDIKQAYRSKTGFLPEDFIEAIGPLIVNVHLCDHVKTENGFRWILPGNGEVEWRNIFNKLSAVKYSGNYFIESYSNSYKITDELYASLEYLNKLDH